jgi:hypothetical protein
LKVDRLKDQLTALLASGDVKLREHAEMWAELKQLREEAAVTESEKAAVGGRRPSEMFCVVCFLSNVCGDCYYIRQLLLT